MTDKILSIDPEKQQRIMNAAAAEFAQKGYADASTNAIVQEAGISKGLLFHYFKNKKELYLFLYNHFTQLMMGEFFEEMDFGERDIFARLKQVMILKARLMERHPGMFDFMVGVHKENSPDVKGELDASNQELMQKNYGAIFDNIDYTLFKDGIDMKRAINIIFWTLEGFSNQVMEKVKSGVHHDFSEDFVEADRYIDMLKQAFYK